MAKSVPAIEALALQIVNFINQDLYLGKLVTLGVTTEVCFDCSLWTEGYTYNDPTNGPTLVIQPIKTTINSIFTNTITVLQNALNDQNDTDYGFKTQIERLLTIVKDLQNKINSIQCTDTCSDITLLAQLLANIVLTMIRLLAAMEYLNGLLAYMGTCGCMGGNFFEILMGRFINAITDLQPVVQDWNNIVLAFFQYSAMSTKAYVASYMPPTPIQVPQMNQGPMQHACVPCPPRPIVQPQVNNCTPYPYC